MLVSFIKKKILIRYSVRKTLLLLLLGGDLLSLRLGEMMW